MAIFRGNGTTDQASEIFNLVPDGDYGDITVSSFGEQWVIDNGVVNTDKLGGDITAAGKALLDDASVADQRTTLGLGSLATASNINGTNWSGTDLALTDGGTGASLTDPNADRMMFWDDSAGSVAWLTPGTGLTVTDTTITNDAIGKQTIWIPAAAMLARTTNGATSGTSETTTNKIMLRTLNYDTATAEYSQFFVQMPKSWNESTVTFRAVWSHAATTTNFGVAWSLQGVAFSDDDAADAAFGTKQTVTDTGGTTDDIYITSESSAITIAGTPAAQDWVVFQVERTVGDAGDTMAIDARLHGIQLFYTTDAGNDA